MIKYLCIHCGAILNPQDIDCSCDNDKNKCSIDPNKGVLAKFDVGRLLCVRRWLVAHRLTCRFQHQVRQISAHEHYAVHVVGCENSGKTSFIQHIPRWLGEPEVQAPGYICYSENLQSPAYPVLIIRDGIVWEHVPNAIMHGIDYSTHLAIPGDLLFTIDVSNYDNEQKDKELEIFNEICRSLGPRIAGMKLALVVTKVDLLLQPDGTKYAYQTLNAAPNRLKQLEDLLTVHGRKPLADAVREKFAERYSTFIVVCTEDVSVGVKESMRWLLGVQDAPIPAVAGAQSPSNVSAHANGYADEDRVPGQDE